MRKILLLAIMTGSFIPVCATRIIYGNNINIRQAVYEDLYIAGGTVTINAPVFGDLIIAGGTIFINDTVMNDILVAGGTVTFNGFVGDDIRCAGGRILVAKNVAGDVVVTGGNVAIDHLVTVGGLLVSGGSININGNVNGDARGAGGDLYINGKISGNVNCRAGTITVNGTIDGKSILSARYIRVGKNARFNNDLRYWSEQKAIDFTPYIASGNATFDPSLRIRNSQWYYLGATTLLALLWYLGMALLMILLITWLFSATLRQAADAAYNHSLRSFLYGLLFLFGVPVATIIAFITLIGVPVGLLLMVGYIIIMLLATVLTSTVVANWINNRFDKNWSYWHLSFIALAIFVLLKLTFITPFVGGVILFFLVCITFGSILQTVKWKKETPLRRPISPLIGKQSV